MAGLIESPKLTEAQRERLRGQMTVYVEEEWHLNPLIHIAHAKRNVRAGKGPYKLVPDYDVFALLDLTKGKDDPRVALVWGDQGYALKDWYSPWTPNDTIVARHDLKAEKLGDGE